MLKTKQLLLILLLVSFFSTSLLAEDPKWKIGNILPFSGVLQEFSGECRQGFELAYSRSPLEVQEIVELQYEDDQSQVKNTLTAFQKLLQDEKLLAVSTFSSANTLAAQTLSVKEQVPLLGLSGHPDFLKNNPYGLSNWQSVDVEAKAFLDYFQERKIERLAMITFEHDYPLAIRKAVSDSADDYGFEIVFDDQIHQHEEQRALVTRLLQTKPEAVFINAFGPSFAFLVKGLAEQNFSGQIFTLNANARSEYIEQAGLKASEGIIFFGPDYYDEAFLALMPPERQSGEGLSYIFVCYAGMKYLLDQIDNLRKDERLSRESLQRELEKDADVQVGKTLLPVLGRRLLYQFTRIVVQDGRLQKF